MGRDPNGVASEGRKTMLPLQEQGRKIKDLCQRKMLILCGRERALCASIELGCSQVVLIKRWYFFQ